MVRVSWPPYQAHQPGGMSDPPALSTLKLKQRVINKCMLPPEVGVLAIPSRRREGTLLGGLAADALQGQVSSGSRGLLGWLLCWPLVPSTHQERASQQSWEPTI